MAKPKAPTEEQVKSAVSVIQRDYYADVASVVEDLKRAIKDKEVTSREGADEWLHEAVEGTQRVIYTWQSRLGLLVSDNADAYFEEMGGGGDICNDGIDYAALMFYAMRADVMQDVEREGVLDALDE